MSELFASGHVVDLILALVAVETAGLVLLWRYTRRGVAPTDLLPNVAAGACLLLALRLQQTGAGWLACCIFLAAGGIAHAADIRRRWRRARMR